MNAPVQPFPHIAEPRNDWRLEEIEALFELPFTELVFRAAEVPPGLVRSHRTADFPAPVREDRRLPRELRLLQQSQHFKTATTASKLMAADEVIAQAAEAKAGGRSGSAWARPGAT